MFDVITRSDCHSTTADYCITECARQSSYHQMDFHSVIITLLCHHEPPSTPSPVVAWFDSIFDSTESCIRASDEEAIENLLDAWSITAHWLHRRHPFCSSSSRTDSASSVHTLLVTVIHTHTQRHVFLYHHVVMTTTNEMRARMVSIDSPLPLLPKSP